MYKDVLSRTKNTVSAGNITENVYCFFLASAAFPPRRTYVKEKRTKGKNRERQNKEGQEERKKGRRTWSLLVTVATKIYRFFSEDTPSCCEVQILIRRVY